MILINLGLLFRLVGLTKSRTWQDLDLSVDPWISTMHSCSLRLYDRPEPSIRGFIIPPFIVLFFSPQSLEALFTSQTIFLCSTISRNTFWSTLFPTFQIFQSHTRVIETMLSFLDREHLPGLIGDKLNYQSVNHPSPFTTKARKHGKPVLWSQIRHCAGH